MAQRTREQLNTANAALFVNNSTGDITPELEKAFNEDVNDSAVNIKGDTFAANAEFAFQNGSKFREGNIPHGFGGGIARVCANEKADQWENGFRYLISTSGSTNTVIYAETINNIIPDDTYDETDSWAVGSRLTNLVTGVTYQCTQANEGDAIWVEVSTDSAYNTLTKAEFDALVLASALIGGQWYNVTDCTYGPLGTVTALALATSTNSISQYFVFIENPYGQNNFISGWISNTNDLNSFIASGGYLSLNAAQAAAITGTPFLPAVRVIIDSLYITRTGDDGSGIATTNVQRVNDGVMGSLSNDFTTFTPHAIVQIFDVTITNAQAIVEMHSNPITLVDGDGYSYVQLLSATIIINADNTQDYDFTGYMGIISDIDGNYRAYSGSVTINNGSGNVEIHRVILNEPSQNNLLMYSKAGTDNNEGGLALTVFGTNATQGDRTIRVYGTYVNIPHNL